MPSNADDSEVARIVARQLGVVTAKQLAGMGIDRAGVKRLVRRGNLTPFSRGLYRSPYAAQTFDQLVMAACLVAPDEAVVSHFTAARILGLQVPQHEIVEMTVFGHTYTNSLGGRVIIHETLYLPDSDRTRRANIRLTSFTRTLADIAPRLGRQLYTRAVDDALTRRLLRPKQLARFLERPEWKRRPGRHQIESALDPWPLDGPAPDSPAEATAIRLLLQAGVERPVCGHKVLVNGSVVARVDLAWPDKKVAVEVNGYRYHSSPRSQEHDSRRLNLIVSAGWVVVGVTPKELDSRPDAFVRAVLVNLASR